MSKQKGFSLVEGLLLILVVAVVGFAGWFAWNQQQENNKDEEIAALNENIESTDNDLSDAESRIEELDNPEKRARDEERKNDLSRFIVELNNYAANNNGQYPSTEPTIFTNQFEAIYITNKIKGFEDPNTKQEYEIVPVANVQTPPGITLGIIQYQWPGNCSGSEFGDDASERQSAARILLETGDIYCLDS